MGAFLSHLRRRRISINIVPVIFVIVLVDDLLKTGCLGVVIVGPSDVEIRLSVIIAVVTIQAGAGQEGTACAMPDIFVLVMSDGRA